jgi:hypothetical protein
MALAASLAALVLAPPPEPDWDALLKPAGLTLQTAVLDPQVLLMFEGDEFVLPAFQAYWTAPFRIPAFGRSLQASLAASVDQPNEAFVAAGRLLGFGTRRTLLGDPLVQPPKSLEAALSSLFLRAGKPAPKDLAKRCGEAEALVGAEGCARVASVVAQAASALDWRDASFHSGAEALFARAQAQEGESGGPRDLAKWLGELRSLDLRPMLAGAHDLFLACHRACKKLPGARPGLVEIPTPYGAVAIGGGGANEYASKPYLLIFDAGGDDTYLGGGRNVGPDNPASVVIDLGGNDLHLSHADLAKAAVAAWGPRKAMRRPGPARAACGIAGVFDLEGNDRYASSGPGIASADFGAAMLWDGAGDDVYDGYSDCEASARFGVALLVDRRGNDRYDAFANAQGFGGTHGAGVLLDVEGDDRYSANDSTLDFPSPQSAEHNASCSQGAAFGRRADYSDGHSMGGGFGVLADLRGNDAYSCGVFGQGVGYWKGVGLLLDAEGDDRYDGVWYVQGAAAHFAVGALLDGSGDDQYRSTMNMSAGAGHDFSIGWLEDLAGNDRYVANTLSFGASNANGIGIFRDAAGDDSYAAPSVCFGWATDPGPGGLRALALGLGVFLDQSGNDRYQTSQGFPQNGSSAVNWTTKVDPPHGGRLGLFVDWSP